MELDIIALGLVVVFLVLAVLYALIELMHVVVSRIENAHKAKQAWKQMQQQQEAGQQKV